MMNSANLPQNSVKIFRSDFKSRLIFLVLFSIPLIISVIVCLLKPIRDIDALVCVFILAIVPQLWLAGYKITIAPF
jgi:hypothetical protein